MKEAYFPQEIEKRWQEIWEKGNVFHTPEATTLILCISSPSPADKNYYKR